MKKMCMGCWREGVYSYSENNDENGAITIELAMIIILTKVSPTSYNSHF